MAPVELLALIDRGAAPPILDVRSRTEFAAGHVPRAINLPYNEIWSRRAEVLTLLGVTPVVYCGHGPRAWIASAMLRRHGLRQVRYLRGHWAGWLRAGLRIDRQADV